MIISGAGGGPFTSALMQGKQLGNQARALREQAHQRRQQLALGIGGLGLNAVEALTGVAGTVGSLSEAAARRQQQAEQYQQDYGLRKDFFAKTMAQREQESLREQQDKQRARDLQSKLAALNLQAGTNRDAWIAQRGRDQDQMALLAQKMEERRKEAAALDAKHAAMMGRPLAREENVQDLLAAGSAQQALLPGTLAIQGTQPMSRAAREQGEFDLKAAIELEHERAKSKPSELASALLPEQMARRTKIGDWEYYGILGPEVAGDLRQRIVGPEGQQGMLPEERTLNRIQDIANKLKISEPTPQSFGRMGQTDYLNALALALMHTPPQYRQSVFNELVRLRELGGGRAEPEFPGLPYTPNPEFLEALKIAMQQR